MTQACNRRGHHGLTCEQVLYKSQGLALPRCVIHLKASGQQFSVQDILLARLQASLTRAYLTRAEILRPRCAKLGW